MTGASDDAAPPTRMADGERRRVTVLFCDIVGSTGLAERAGSDSMSEVIQAFLHRTLPEIERHGGTVSAFLGDGILALFGAPIAMEDHAERAVRAAWAIARALALVPVTVPGTGERIAARIGLNTGEVVVGHVGDGPSRAYTAIGDAVNTAARLQAAAAPGAIDISASTFGLVRRMVDATALGDRELRGRGAPVTVYRLQGIREDPPDRTEPTRTSLVGRESELDRLLALVLRADAESPGPGGVAIVTGEAGSGKSRLLAELRLRSAGDEPPQWLMARSTSLGRSTGYFPVTGMLRRWAGIADGDPPDRALAMLRARANEALGAGASAAVPHLASLAGLALQDESRIRRDLTDGSSVRAQILLSVRRLVEALANRRRVALVLEDAHWMDATSAELIEHLIPLASTTGLVVIWVSRASDDTFLPRLRTAARRLPPERFAEISLEPLGIESSGELLDLLPGVATLGTAQRARIIDSAGGNPLFLEELARSIVDSRGGDRSVPTTVGVLSASAPTTVQEVILSRIDRLPADAKDLITVASVVGRTFSRRMLEEMQGAIAVEAAIAPLLDRDLIRMSRGGEEDRFVFRHALVRETAYATLVRARRRELHRRAGQAIETLWAGRLDGVRGLLAYHYAEAESWEEARHHLLAAAQGAGRIAADREALAAYREALRTHERVFGTRWNPVERAALERGMGQALFRLGEHEAAREHLEAALSALEAPYPASTAGDRRALLRRMGREALRGGPVPNGRSADETLRDAELTAAYTTLVWIDFIVDPQRYTLDCLLMLDHTARTGDLSGWAGAAAAYALALAHSPLRRTAPRYVRRSLELAERTDDTLVQGAAWFARGFTEMLRGDFVAGLESLGRAEVLYQDGGELRPAGVSAILRSRILRQCGRFSEALDVVQGVAAIAEDTSDHELSAYALQSRAGVLSCQGDWTTALALLAEARAHYRSAPSATAVTLQTEIGRCHLRLGRRAEALAAIEEGEALVARHGFSGIHAVHAPAVAAEIHLASVRAGRDAGPLQRAREAAEEAARRSRVAREGVPGALRVRALCDHAEGAVRRARRGLRRGAEEAERLGMRYEAALTHLELGCLFHDEHAATLAQQSFEAMGASLALAVLTSQRPTG
ncbi:MAG TPA: adenylate/guanylate cyclase domain-containing protein [Miltoncostaeaceae bacterium]|nr:adenylate/guanylate cyclase domain-containing protein [Miltoncostaeaceae bacterium]